VAYLHMLGRGGGGWKVGGMWVERARAGTCGDGGTDLGKCFT
jgi:hypothetical protein